MTRLLSSVLADYGDSVAFHCPGCSSKHVVRIRGEGGPRWGYNGKAAAPTFTPSVLVTYNGDDAGADDAPPSICHSFITDGRIQFLGDCTHGLVGSTMSLPPYPIR